MTARPAAADLEPVALRPAEVAHTARADFDKWSGVQAKVDLQLD